MLNRTGRAKAPVQAMRHQAAGTLNCRYEEAPLVRVFLSYGGVFYQSHAGAKALQSDPSR
jgi:hypothetical protein